MVHRPRNPVMTAPDYRIHFAYLRHITEGIDHHQECDTMQRSLSLHEFLAMVALPVATLEVFPGKVLAETVGKGYLS